MSSDLAHPGAAAPPEVTLQGIRWWRVALLLLCCLAAAEGVCRVVIRVRFDQPFRSLDAYSFSGYGVYRQNARYTHPQFVHNAAGFRNLREFPLEKPPNTFRVMTIGASVLYSGSAITSGGFSRRVRTDETISAYLLPLLEALPELAGRRVEVLNPSVNRHNLRHTLAYYTAELAPYDPDLVVIFGTHNDSAYLELTDAMSTMFYDRQRPTPEEQRLEQLLNEASLTALVEKTVRVAVNRSAAAATAYRVGDRLLKVVANRINTRPPRAQQLAGPDQIERHLRFYLAGLDALTGYVQTQGAQPVVFWEYLLLLVDDRKPLTEYEGVLAEFLQRHTGGLSAERKRLKWMIHDRVADHLAARGVPLIDIQDALREYDGELYNDYLHYSAPGNRWVAGVIARELQPLIRARLAAAAADSP